jgi:hypothetical protein
MGLINGRVGGDYLSGRTGGGALDEARPTAVRPGHVRN